MVKKSKNESNEKLEQLEKENDELRDSYARLAADFDNFRKRIEKQRQDTQELSEINLMTKLFPIYDNFRRASEHAPDISSENEKVTKEDLSKIKGYIEGIQQIEKQFESILENVGLSRIQTINQKFDLHTMEAIAYEPSDLEEGFVIDEYESGYKFKDRVIRPAKVRVSSGTK